MSTTQTFDITVNGVAKVWQKPTISYAQVITLAGTTGTPTIRYSWGSGKLLRSGFMQPSKALRIATGMAFSVIHTSHG